MKATVSSLSKKGMTLAELIVALAILSIIMVGVSVFIVSIWRSQSFALENGIASVQASQSVTKLVDSIRNARQSDNGAYPILLADENELTIFSDVDGDGEAERVHYYLSSGTIYAGITSPSGSPPSYPGSDQTVEIIAQDVENAGSEPVFVYFDNVNQVLSSSPVVSDVRMVRVFLKIDIDPSRSPVPTEFESFASIRNLNEYDRIQ